MKTHLTLKHLVPYLPYQLLIHQEGGYSVEMNLNNIESLSDGIYGMPILYPLSWLTKPIEHNGEKFVPEYWIDDKLGRSIDDVITDNKFVLELPYFVMQKLIEWHFNVFNLPEYLYIDKSTIK